MQRKRSSRGLIRCYDGRGLGRGEAHPDCSATEGVCSSFLWPCVVLPLPALAHPARVPVQPTLVADTDIGPMIHLSMGYGLIHPLIICYTNH